MGSVLSLDALTDGAVAGQLGGGFVELAVLFLVLAMLAGVAGVSGVAGLSMTIARWFVIAFIVLAVASLLL